MIAAIALRLAWSAPPLAGPAPPPAPPPPGVSTTEAATAAPLPASSFGPIGRVASARAPILAANRASARERALDEALQQALKIATEDLLRAESGASAPSKSRGMPRDRRFIRRYKILSEADDGGGVRVTVDADIDLTALRRQLVDVAAGAVPVGEAAEHFTLAVEGDAELGAVLVRTVAAAGPVLVLVAGGGAARPVVHLSATVLDEGMVRGTDRRAALCRATLTRLRTEFVDEAREVVEERAFAADAAGAIAGCRDRVGKRLAAWLAPRLGRAGAPPGALTLGIDIVEPAALPLLLRAVRALSLVSSTEVRRLSRERAVLRVGTRATPAVLLSALLAEAGTTLLLTSTGQGRDTLSLRVRLPRGGGTGDPAPPGPVPAGSAHSPAAPPSPPGPLR